MANDIAKTTYRKDYQEPAFWIDHVELTFDLDSEKTRVLNRMTMRRNLNTPVQALRLDGEDISLSRVLVDGKGSSFKLDGNQLVLDNLPEDGSFTLELFTTCCPAKNTQLMGIFVSNETLFTQCEAEGFRRITYFLDRPDVMATYSVLLRADQAKYPVLLSNGNLIESGQLAEGRHFAKWHDPFKKPSYLFALVAGRLVCREQTVTARSGKQHLLQVYVRPGDLDKTEHALQSLIDSIAWDEARFGLSLDLDRFMIVATSDFNMGAMENKGLNIFNTKFVLASPTTATDVDYGNVLAVVGHEYFHNWTGNRITCRDWFQLSLKEGLTVFRDQEFTLDLCPDHSSRAVKRIEDVRNLRSMQFPEDSGPMSHPVRPDSYEEISNFYTMTIYEKGAEVVRMMQTLVGRDGFAKGMTLYFDRHDGQAVTCDDFAQAIADANPQSELAHHLTQFKLWYSQSGTPEVRLTSQYFPDSHTLQVQLQQTCAATAGQSQKQAFVIPIKLGLVGKNGAPLTCQLKGQALTETANEFLYVLTQDQVTLEFTGVNHEPIVSALRDFSAPVQLHCDYSTDELVTLMLHDLDPFNRWEASQRLALSVLLPRIQQSLPEAVLAQRQEQLINAFAQILQDQQLDSAFKELILNLPIYNYLAEQLDIIDPQAIQHARDSLKQAISIALYDHWLHTAQNLQTHVAYSPDALSAGRRSLLGLALMHLCNAAQLKQDVIWPGRCYEMVKSANNLTDRMNAFNALIASGHSLATAAAEHFYTAAKSDALVLDKWFTAQALAPDVAGSTVQAVKQLMKHSDFEIKNPNRARSLIFAFCNSNPGAFHQANGAGYAFWADRVLELDALNPQVSARLARSLDAWKKLAIPYRQSAQEALERIAQKSDLSKDLNEVIHKALAADVVA